MRAPRALKGIFGEMLDRLLRRINVAPRRHGSARRLEIEPVRLGTIDRSQVKHVQQHELETAERLAAAGHDVTFMPPSEASGERTADILLDGRVHELKSPIGTGPATIIQNLRSAQAEAVVLDTARTSLTVGQIIAQATSAMHRYPRLRQVMILHDGTSTLLRREV